MKGECVALTSRDGNEDVEDTVDNELDVPVAAYTVFSIPLPFPACPPSADRTPLGYLLIHFASAGRRKG